MSTLVRLLIHARGQVIFALVAFGFIAAFSISPYWLRPYDGISYSIYGGEVSLIDRGGPGDRAGVLVEDRVLAIGSLPMDPCFLRPIYPLDVRPGDAVIYEIQRGAQMLSLPVVIGSFFDEPTSFGPVLITTFLALWFWVIGLALCLFAPAQDVRGRLTGLYWLLAAIVMAGGLGIQSGFWASGTIMGVAWCLLSGVFVAAHLYFPAPVFNTSLRRRLVQGLAVLSLLLVGWNIADDWVIKPCMSFYLKSGISVGTITAIVFLLAVLASVGLLAYQRSRNGSVARRQVNLILWGMVFGFGPFFILTLLPYLLYKQEFVPGSYTVLFMAPIPLVYGYVIYQRKLLRLDFVINRLVVFFALAWLTLLSALTFLSLVVWILHLPIQLAFYGGLLAIVVVLPSAFLRAKVQVYVNRALYGDNYDFSTVTAHFSGRLACTLERQVLVDLLTHDLSHQMGIQKIALLLLEGEQLQTQENQFAVSLEDEMCTMLLGCGVPMRAPQLWERLSSDTSEVWQGFVWAELFVPIIFEGMLQGLLVLGERSIGDVYSDQDIRIIATIAHQGAIAYANVKLLEQKKGLVQQLVRWEEAQRKQLALDLHDLVLPEVIFARYRMDQSPTEAELILDRVTERLQQMVTNQRTLMIDQGLDLALQELVKGMQAIAGEKPALRLRGRLLKTCLLSEEKVIAFYRVAQEAIRNSLQHAKAEHISVILEQSDGMLRLIVEDDGIGFRAAQMGPMGAGVSHYGILGMRERASMIGGSVRIESDPGEGTTVILEIKSSQA